MKRNIIQIIVAYTIVLAYIVLVNNKVVNVFLVIALILYHINSVTSIRSKIQQDKKTSVSKLQYKLDKIEQEKQETYKQFVSLSRSFGSGFLMVNEEGLITITNKDIEKYFKLKVSGKNYEVLSKVKGLYDFVHQAYLLETSLRRQIHHKSRDYDLISTPLNEGGLFKGCLILVHDITVIKNAEKYQKQFTADVSHELKTPLSAIKGFSEILLRNDAIEDKDRTEFLEHIQNESLRMEHILKDLTIIAQMDRVDYELELIRTDVKDLIMETFNVLKNKAKNTGLTLTCEAEPQLLALDKFKFSQVLVNMINNAINYTDKGTVSVRGYIKDEKYYIEIEDSGIGIKEEDYQNIFKRFYRVDKNRSRETGGSGLGLSISKNVVKKHGGKISIKSELNKGSIFTIKIPIKR